VSVKHQARALPKVVEARVTRVARRLRKPRGVVLREAIEEYAARHEPEAVTQAMNRVVAVLDTRLDPGLAAASRRVLERTEW
jgi:predicted transcriptional regulator